ncbi:putative DnaJ domain, Chaperone J-domain superfamily [Helianthus annuus]|nr:putative DnaJ domain, Chaperone J-domain superfamily [Helianthus annuus]
MATAGGVINGCVSSSLSSSSFGKLKSCREKMMANGGSGKRFRVCCGSTNNDLASDPYKVLRVQPGASESEVKTAFRQLALKVVFLANELDCLYY